MVSILTMGEAAQQQSAPDVEDLEIHLLTEAVYRRYGYDLRAFRPEFVGQMVRSSVAAEGLRNVSTLQERVLRDPIAMERLLFASSNSPGGLFTPPSLYVTLRNRVIPELRDGFFVRAWQVGASPPENLYSLGVIFVEEGLQDYSRIYVTDLSDTALKRARKGAFPLQEVKRSDAAYSESGGRHSLQHYFTFSFDSAVINPLLRKNIVFSQHNVATDASFNEFQLIICRGILSRYNADLRRRALQLFHQSLSGGGFIILGNADAELLAGQEAYELFNEEHGIFRRLR